MFGYDIELYHSILSMETKLNRPLPKGILYAIMVP